MGGLSALSEVLPGCRIDAEPGRPVLSAQRSKARGEAVAAMKSEGIEYDERIELLDEVTPPRPLAELLGAAYESYRKGHPWVVDHELRPKSIVRDMYERAMTFVEYVGFYGLARSEGLLLRYLTDGYRALRRTVPDAARTDELDDLVAWLGELVRQVDSSLLDEWEKLAAGEDAASVAVSLAASTSTSIDAPVRPVTANARAFRVLVRNALFRRVELAARRDWAALGELDADAGWGAEAWQNALSPYWDEHALVLTDADARGPGLLIIDTDPEYDEETDRPHDRIWKVRQILHDPAGHHDWGINADIDLAASDAAGEAVIRVTSVGML